MIWQALSISRSLAMAKASAAEGQTNCKELQNMIIQELVGATGRIDYVEVCITSCIQIPSFILLLNIKGACI